MDRYRYGRSWNLNFVPMSPLSVYSVLPSFLSILLITAIVWRLNSIFGKRICPICVGVSGTWLSLLAARAAGLPVDPVLIGILMGGSVVGIAYRAERYLAAARSPLAWKVWFMTAGFGLVYGIVRESFVYAAIGGALVVCSLPYFFRSRQLQPPESEAQKHIQEKLKNCCS